jgi:hypothetical protein
MSASSELLRLKTYRLSILLVTWFTRIPHLSEYLALMEAARVRFMFEAFDIILRRDAVYGEFMENMRLVESAFCQWD